MRAAKWKSIAFLAVAGAIAAGAQAHASRVEGPFPQLLGSWSGTGQVRFEKGNSEPITCRAYYNSTGDGADLSLAVRCASSSYKIEMRANLSQYNGRVTGHWEERTFNATGAVNGSASGPKLELAISGAVTGTMAVTVGETGHRIDLKTTGTGLAGVSINLARG
jgi:hypothetical protein